MGLLYGRERNDVSSIIPSQSPVALVVNFIASCILHCIRCSFSCSRLSFSSLTYSLSIRVFGQTRQSDGSCSEAKAGYTFDSSLLRLLRIDDDLDLLSQTLTAALVLHPIACGFAFIALIFAIIFSIRKRRVNATGYGWQGLTLISTLAALGIALVAFIIDIVLIATLRNRVKDVSDDTVVVEFGNAVRLYTLLLR